MGKKKQYLGGSHVRGVTVPVYHEGINSMYFGNSGTPHREYEENIPLKNIESQWVWLVEVIEALGNIPPWIHPRTLIQKASLNIEAKFWKKKKKKASVQSIDLTVGFEEMAQPTTTTMSAPPSAFIGIASSSTTVGSTSSGVPPTTSVAPPQGVRPSSVARTLGVVDSKVTNFIKTIPDMIKAAVVEVNKDLRERVDGLEKRIEKVEE
ncbi:hypothetical protein RND71_028570 [Anisodus tanguticus]|uniref:Uncharacterized protein n=1 Tax=Anisodus tanguticus TaxID=243964 RepID=A0AAE1RLA6_9SOLA|nr:hypothetical protein RND71_028570 [Anisodus tanguticus]